MLWSVAACLFLVNRPDFGKNSKILQILKIPTYTEGVDILGSSFRRIPS